MLQFHSVQVVQYVYVYLYLYFVSIVGAVIGPYCILPYLCVWVLPLPISHSQVGFILLLQYLDSH